MRASLPASDAQRARRGRRRALRLLTSASLLASFATGFGVTPIAEKASASAVAEPPLTSAVQGSWTVRSYNPFNPDYLSPLDAYVILPLAYPAARTYFLRYIPQLATSWSATKTRIVIHLRRNAKWSNGDPVTARDVATTLLLEGVDGDSVWEHLAGLTTPKADTVILTLRRGVSSAVILNDVLPLYLIPTSQFGRFVTSSLQQTLLSYYGTLATKGESAAAATPAGRQISGLLSRLTKYNPHTLIGDGPFGIARANSEELLLHKSQTFWDAAKVHVQSAAWIIFTTSVATYAGMFSNRIDVTTTGVTTSVLDRWAKASSHHWIKEPRLAQNDLVINDGRYPFTILDVRKAMAYAISRPKVVDGVGELYNPPIHYPDGLSNSEASRWIGGTRLAGLDPYHYSPVTAKRLLREAGFHLRKGSWVMPNGHPFKVTVEGPADESSAVITVSGMLKAIGINSAAEPLPPTTWETDLSSGSFDVTINVTGDGIDPLVTLENQLGGQIDYIGSGINKGEKGLGFGPMATVPGLGTINVPQTLDSQATAAGPSEWKQLSYDWGRLIDRQLPFIPLFEFWMPVSYTTAHYVDWPARSSPLWRQFSNNIFAGVPLMLEDGYIRPKGS